LSPRKFAEWGIDHASVLTRGATVAGFRSLTRKLDEWLNGSVFPLPTTTGPPLQDYHIGFVAGIFRGDQLVAEDESALQLALDFQVYDFSYIPIETLSVVYEQFLHAVDADEPRSRGREQGAYYTPVPLVDFVLTELDQRLPLQLGRRVLDPACGSGAFLVQCYRRLVERERKRRLPGALSPDDLRNLLVEHIFGVDRDPDACQIARLSLTLALLDNVELDDLDGNPDFRLPDLGRHNVIAGDFFDTEIPWQTKCSHTTFDWIVGNPPWVSITPSDAGRYETGQWPWGHVWKWLSAPERKRVFPVGGNQAAEAFAWKVTEHLRDDGVIGLVLPAMSLFNDASKRFRAKLFSSTHVWCVANFANLAYTLFAGRSQEPAAAFFYGLRAHSNIPSENLAATDDSPATCDDERIVVFSPLVANQNANRPHKASSKMHVWNIVVNANEVQEIPTTVAATGNMLPWKLAMWGSHRDGRLIARLRRRFPTLGDVARGQNIEIQQGFPLRGDNPTAEDSERTQFVEELVGKLRVHFPSLRGSMRLFSLPPGALRTIGRNQAHMRLRSGMAGLAVSRPPHVIVDAGGRFAVYSDEFVAVQQPHVGIAGDASKSMFLRALAAYLSSHFATYHQFFGTPEWGIRSNRITKKSLLRLPLPFVEAQDDVTRDLARLQQALAACAEPRTSDFEMVSPSEPNARETTALQDELNRQVYAALRLSEREQVLVSEFVSVRLGLIKGKINAWVLDPPPDSDMMAYLTTLRDELDRFVSGNPSVRHFVCAVFGEQSAVVSVALEQQGTHDNTPRLWQADTSEARELDRIRMNLQRRFGQWTYFNRSLHVYDGPLTYVMKPMERFLWTRTQAMLDAGDIIADTLAGVES